MKSHNLIAQFRTYRARLESLVHHAPATFRVAVVDHPYSADLPAHVMSYGDVMSWILREPVGSVAWPSDTLGSTAYCYLALTPGEPVPGVANALEQVTIALEPLCRQLPGTLASERGDAQRGWWRVVLGLVERGTEPLLAGPVWRIVLDDGGHPVRISGAVPWADASLASRERFPGLRLYAPNDDARWLTLIALDCVLHKLEAPAIDALAPASTTSLAILQLIRRLKAHLRAAGRPPVKSELDAIYTALEGLARKRYPTGSLSGLIGSPPPDAPSGPDTERWLEFAHENCRLAYYGWEQTPPRPCPRPIICQPLLAPPTMDALQRLRVAAEAVPLARQTADETRVLAEALRAIERPFRTFSSDAVTWTAAGGAMRACGTPARAVRQLFQVADAHERRWGRDVDGAPLTNAVRRVLAQAYGLAFDGDGAGAAATVTDALALPGFPQGHHVEAELDEIGTGFLRGILEPIAERRYEQVRERFTAMVTERGWAMEELLPVLVCHFDIAASGESGPYEPDRLLRSLLNAVDVGEWRDSPAVVAAPAVSIGWLATSVASLSDGSHNSHNSRNGLPVPPDGERYLPASEEAKRFPVPVAGRFAWTRDGSFVLVWELDGRTHEAPCDGAILRCEPKDAHWLPVGWTVEHIPTGWTRSHAERWLKWAKSWCEMCVQHPTDLTGEFRRRGGSKYPLPMELVRDACLLMNRMTLAVPAAIRDAVAKAERALRGLPVSGWESEVFGWGLAWRYLDELQTLAGAEPVADLQAPPERPATKGRSRMSREAANRRAAELHAENGHVFLTYSLRQWAELIGCAEGMVVNLTLWKLHRKGKKRPGQRGVRTVPLPPNDLLAAPADHHGSGGHGDDAEHEPETLESLIRDHEAEDRSDRSRRPRRPR